MKKTFLAVIFALFLSCGQQSEELEVVTPVDDGGRGVEGGIVIIDNPDDSVVSPED